jgi:hypothetical protein
MLRDPRRQNTQAGMKTLPADTQFVQETVHKRDPFSETVSGYAADDPSEKLVMRRLGSLPLWSRWIGWALARKEIRGLKAVAGIEGTPQLIRVDREGILRTWSHGTPLQLAKPKDAAWYKDAKRLLREMRKRGVSHNDLAKPQNWLMTPDGRASVIDFQLAAVHNNRGRLHRIMAYEDLRHLLKQKRKYAKSLLTPAEKKMLERRALPSRIWMATAKPLYNFVTRKLMNWSDGEGTENRVAKEGPALREELMSHPRVQEVAFATFALPARGVGLYGFVETDLDQSIVRSFIPEKRVEHLQAVMRLPRDMDGSIRSDILQLVAMNRAEELQMVMEQDPTLAETLRPIVNERLNLTDRQLRGS